MRNMRGPKVKSGLKRGQRSAVRDAWQNRFINNNRRVKGRNGLTVLGKTWLIDGKNHHLRSVSKHRKVSQDDVEP